jgi:hypothetical protein
LGRGAAGTPTLGSLAKCLLEAIPVIGFEVLATRPTFAFGCHFALIFQALPARCKGKKSEARKDTAEKKEEDFSANVSKKSPAKKIHFQTGSFDPFPFHRWHA